MIYLMTDIHGDIEKYKAMLDRIEFDKTADKLYILGDCIDRGKHGLLLLNEVMQGIKEGYIVLIKGNHELFMQQYLEGKLRGMLWDAFGGEDTREALDRCTKEEKDMYYEFIKSLPLYLKINVSGKEVLLTHSGIDVDYLVYDSEKINVAKSIELGAKKDEYRLLISDDIHYMASKQRKMFDTYVYCGHYPCRRIEDHKRDDIYVSDTYTDLDTGNGLENGRLCCLCINNGNVYYI